MENGYAFVPSDPSVPPATFADLVGVEPNIRVVIPLTGDFSAYVAIDDAGGRDVPTALGGFAVTARAVVFVGREVLEVTELMPTRDEPPGDYVGFVLLACVPGTTEQAAIEAASVEQTIGLTRAGSGYDLLVELSAPDRAGIEKARDLVMTVAGPSVVRSAWAYGRVDDGAWRDR